MKKDMPYTVIVRKSIRELVGVCLELNVSARGKDLGELEINLKNAINEYVEYIREEDIEPIPMQTGEIVEFLRDTAPEGDPVRDNRIFRALELNEVPLSV